MLLLGLDLETTGLNPDADDIIEIAAVIWDTHRQSPIKIYNELVQTQQILSPEITRLTGIEQSDLNNWGVSPQEILFNLESLSKKCSYIVAHNAKEFDQKFILRYLKENPEVQITLPWIDTLTDLPYPNDMKTRKLMHLGAEHGFLNPFPHRSLFDVLTMFKILSHYPIEQVIELLESPLVRAVAQVSFDEREKAKTLGFKWDPQRKEWFKSLREIQLKQEEYPFKIISETL